MKYDVHPAADAFPMLTGERFDTLVKSIRANGLREPVTIWKDSDGKEWLLDGRNRMRACEMAGVEATLRWWDGEDPWSYVWDYNGERRDLEPGQRVAIFSILLEGQAAWQQARAERLGRQSPGGSKKRSGGKTARFIGSNVATDETERPDQSEKTDQTEKTHQSLARLARVSPRTAQKAITVGKKAPERLRAIAAGEEKLHKVYNEVVGEPDAEVRKKAKPKKEPKLLEEGDIELSEKCARLRVLLSDQRQTWHPGNMKQFARVLRQMLEVISHVK